VNLAVLTYIYRKGYNIYTGLLEGKLVLNTKELIYSELLSEIVKLKIKPGEFIKENDLSLRFKISRTPLREILKRLEAEGYLTVLPRHGTKVTLIDPISVRQMLEMRIQLETKVQKDLIFNLTLKDIETLGECLKSQETALTDKDIELFWELDNQFHERLFSLAGKSLWWDIIRKYEAHYMRYRRLAMADDNNFELLYIHHKNILKSITERKIEEIEPQLLSHVGFCTEKMPVLLYKYPEYFKK
jgi:GntR family transcriptional regulator, rspAB operon transcriptional repressor